MVALNGNNGSPVGAGGLCGRAIGSCGTGVFGSWTYEQVYGSGQVEEWHHYALVWSNDTLPGVDNGTRKVAVYLDGELDTTRWDNPGPASALENPMLSLLPMNHALGQGSIAFDNVKLWNYAKQDFSDRFLEGDYGLVLHYTFDEDTGTNVLDQSGCSNNAVAFGAVRTADPVHGWVCEFDGLDDYLEVTGYKGVLGHNPMSISVWAKSDVFTSSDTML